MIKHTDSPRRSLQLCQNPHSYFRPLFNWSGRLWYDVGLHPLKALKFLNLFAFLLCTKIQPVENSRSSCQRHRSRQSSITCVWYFQSVPERHSPFAPPFDTKKYFIERQAIANSKEQTCQVIHTVSNATSVRADTIRRSLNIEHKVASAKFCCWTEIERNFHNMQSWSFVPFAKNFGECCCGRRVQLVFAFQCLYSPSVSLK